MPALSGVSCSRLSTALLVGAAIIAIPVRAAAEPPALRCDALNRSARQALDAIPSQVHAGVSVAVLCGGEIVAYAAGGATSRPYLLGSLTKGITATAILQLAAAGRLRLDDRASEFVPELASRPEITIYDLLTHQSGLRDLTSLLAYDDTARQLYIDPHKTVAQIVQLPDAENVANDGQRYSSTDYIALGIAIENICKESYEHYISREIAVPSGAQFHFMTEPEALRMLSTPMEEYAAPAPRSLVATAGVIATAKDVAAFDRALLFGKVLSAASVRTMFEPRASGNGRIALGWFRSTFYQHDVAWHDGAAGHYRAANLILPAENIAVVVLSSDESTYPAVIAQELLHRAGTRVGP